MSASSRPPERPTMKPKVVYSRVFFNATVMTSGNC
ncbi:Uncharacterised protein [Mycobacterium tuberculosis]|nr:Uncharacterised protein [Mycobacterium tuberculosis]